MPKAKRKSDGSSDTSSRRSDRIEILCFPHEKAAIQRRAGNVPLGRWARIHLLGKRPARPDAVPVERMLGFAETIERLALNGDMEAIISVARSVQEHLRRSNP